MKYRLAIDRGRRGKVAVAPAASLADARKAMRVKQEASPRAVFVVQVFLDGAWEDYD